jgi:hypothetical protein
VAIKVIDKVKLSDPNEQKRIQREIKVLKRLNHESVIRLFEVIDSEPKMWLVMEYAPGGSLLDYVRSRKRLPEPEAAYFFQQIVAGLRYCHECEVRGAAPRRGGRPCLAPRASCVRPGGSATRACFACSHRAGLAPPPSVLTTSPPPPPLPSARPHHHKHHHHHNHHHNQCSPPRTPRSCTATSSWRTSCWTRAPP